MIGPTCVFVINKKSSNIEVVIFYLYSKDVLGFLPKHAPF